VKMMILAPISVKMWNTVKRTAWDVMIKETWACYVRTIVKINAVNAWNAISKTILAKGNVELSMMRIPATANVTSAGFSKIAVKRKTKPVSLIVEIAQNAMQNKMLLRVPRLREMKMTRKKMGTMMIKMVTTMIKMTTRMIKMTMMIKMGTMMIKMWKRKMMMKKKMIKMTMKKKMRKKMKMRMRKKMNDYMPFYQNNKL
jgi:hypothetical protein